VVLLLLVDSVCLLLVVVGLLLDRKDYLLLNVPTVVQFPDSERVVDETAVVGTMPVRGNSVGMG
jgi:hypothetical protein